MQPSLQPDFRFYLQTRQDCRPAAAVGHVTEVNKGHVTEDIGLKARGNILTCTSEAEQR